MSGTQPAFFADSISRVGVAAGCVRIEFTIVHPPVAQGEAVKAEPVMNLAMPLEGFVNAFGALENLMRQMQDAGIVVRREGGQGAPGNDRGAAVPANPVKKK